MITDRIAILPAIDARFLELRALGLGVAAIAVMLDRGEAWVKKRPARLKAAGVEVPDVAIGRPAGAATGKAASKSPAGKAASRKPPPREARKPPAGKTATAARVPREAPQPRATPAPTCTPLAAIDPAGIDLFALEATSCRWPLAGEGLATRFCGARAWQGAYCPCHRRRAFLSTSEDLP